MKVIVIMCPVCGLMTYPDENDHSQNICRYCGSEKILTDGDGDAMFIMDGDERTPLEEKLQRKYLFTNPQFNEELYEAREKKEKDYMDGIRKRVEQARYERDHPSCPRCRSTAITAGQRGYSIITGFFGSNQTVNRCASCGHKWKP